MSELHPETLAEKIRYLGSGCHCNGCRGSDDQISECIKGVTEQLQAANDRLTKMLELAARQIIVAVPLEQFDGSLWRAKYDRAGTFWQFVCDANKKCINYLTPVEALKAAFEEWEKRKEKEQHNG